MSQALADVGVSVLDCEHKTPPAQPSGFPYIAIPDIQDGRVLVNQARLISEADLSEWTRRTTPRGGDILVTRRGRVGDTAPIPDGLQCAIGQNLVLLRSDGTRVDQAFLRWAVRSPQWWSEVDRLMNVGAVFSSLNVRDIARIRLNFPPLPEQQAIAEVLGALDDKITANTQLVEKLLEFVNAEFLRQFGDRSLDTSLGSLADVIDCLHSKKPERLPDGPTLMQLNNIRDDGLIDRTSNYCISAEDYSQWSRKFETRAWDLVITNVGRIGAVARIPQAYTVAIGRNMTGIRPRNVAESGAFITAALLSSAVRREIDQRTDAGSVMSALNVRSVPQLRLQCSTPSERQNFHKSAAPFFENADAVLVENALLAATRDALLPQLMSGRLRVRDAQAAASAAVA